MKYLTEITSGVSIDLPLFYWSFYVDIRSNSTTPRRVALARMFKEAGLRSPGTQLTKVQLEMSVRGRRTEANLSANQTNMYESSILRKPCSAMQQQSVTDRRTK